MSFTTAAPSSSARRATSRGRCRWRRGPRCAPRECGARARDAAIRPRPRGPPRRPRGLPADVDSVGALGDHPLGALERAVRGGVAGRRRGRNRACVEDADDAGAGGQIPGTAAELKDERLAGAHSSRGPPHDITPFRGSRSARCARRRSLVPGVAGPCGGGIGLRRAVPLVPGRPRAGSSLPPRSTVSISSPSSTSRSRSSGEGVPACPCCRAGAAARGCTRPPRAPAPPRR